MRFSGAALVMTGFLVVSAAATGCGSSTRESTSNIPVVSFAAEAPQGYDPCRDVPRDVLDAHQLHSEEPVSGKDRFSVGGGKPHLVDYRGCRWFRTDSYWVEVTVTARTLDLALWDHRRIRPKLVEPQELTTDGRRALVRRPQNSALNVICTANIEMKGGSLEIVVYDRSVGFTYGITTVPANPGSNEVCVVARSLTERIAPSLPATA
ncbi:DUF3558 family protein [Nocardia sp. NPDC058497]|uniref:DUF3558 family protein n=1 Tax=Nocardia sp. NPDC058497 TaxID=3346529 RepID=UPI00364DBE30